MTDLKSHLVPPRYSGDGNVGDGAAEQSESVSDLMEQRDVFADARRDIVTYLVHNSLEPDSAVDVRKSVNQRHFLKWTDIDRLIQEVQPVAQREIARRLAEREQKEHAAREFNELANPLRAFGMSVTESDGAYIVSGISEEQLRIIGDALDGDDQ